MKKLLLSLTLGLFLMLNVGVFVGAEPGEPEEPAIIEVYPYDEIDCSLELDTCKNLKVGSDNWTLQYNGYNYHFVRGSVRYGSKLADGNDDGFISGAELGAPSYNAFGMLIINDTDQLLKLRDGDREPLTAVQHRMYAYYDADGVLQMYENHISAFHMVNDNHGVDGAEDAWRLANELEKENYDAAAADAKPANMLQTRLRMIRDSENPNGYKLEPLGNLKWTSSFYNPDDPESKKSQFLDYDPNEVHIPARWTVQTFGTHDRGAYKPAFDMMYSLPATFLEETPQKAVVKYNEIAPKLNGFAGLDDNPYVPGVQIVANFGETFAPDFSKLTATWVKMFDDEGNIINQKDTKIDFKLEISQEGLTPDVLTFTLGEDDKYTQSGAITIVDTEKFEEIYTIKMSAVTPKDVAHEVEGIIVVGVLPNRFEGVAGKFGEDGKYIDLLEGIKAFNGNGLDITDNIKVTYPANFNPYNPQPGTYEIILDVAYEHVWEPILHTVGTREGLKVTIEGKDAGDAPKTYEQVIDYPSKYNVPFSKEASALLTYIDYDHKELVAETRGMAWGTVAAVVNEEGKIIRTWNGFTAYTETWFNAEGVVETKTHADGGAMNTAVAAYELQEGEYMLLAHGGAEGTFARFSHGGTVTIEGRAEMRYTAEAQVKYSVKIDDKTAPVIRVVNSNYKVDKDMFETVEDAILANVVGWDNFSDVDFIVDDSGGLDLNVPGTYTVMVTAEDKAANDASVSFTVEVVAAKLSEAEVTDLLNAQKEALEAVIQEQQELIQAQKDALEALQGKVDTTLPNDNKEYTDGKVAEANAAAAAADARAKAAEDKAAELQTQIDQINAKPALKAGVQLWVVILLVLIGSGAAFGAAFLLGKKQ